MIFLGYLLYALGSVLKILINLFIFIFVARAILSWVSPDPRNAIVQFINGMTDPILYQVRRYIRPVGMLDLSVLVVILFLFFLEMALVEYVLNQAAILKSSGAMSQTLPIEM